jgi:hypothetical protein
MKNAHIVVKTQLQRGLTKTYAGDLSEVAEPEVEDLLRQCAAEGLTRLTSAVDGSIAGTVACKEEGASSTRRFDAQFHIAMSGQRPIGVQGGGGLRSPSGSQNGLSAARELAAQPVRVAEEATRARAAATDDTQQTERFRGAIASYWPLYQKLWCADVEQLTVRLGSDGSVRIRVKRLPSAVGTAFSTAAGSAVTQKLFRTVLGLLLVLLGAVMVLALRR